MKIFKDKVFAELEQNSIKPASIYYQETAQNLETQTLELHQGVLNDTGALVVMTGKFTGRSPKDKFIVQDAVSDKSIFWNEFNIPLNENHFEQLYKDMLNYVQKKTVWVRDAYACDHADYRLNIRVINENPWSNLFVYNMFLRPTNNELENFKSDWLILQIPSFQANPAIHGTRQENFSIIHFSKKIILIGGTAYTGEIKKGVFTVLNYILPHEKNILSMHCSANKSNQDTAIFFGLSGTGKTTLSADPARFLIGDDEHAWTDHHVFNFEGGCYAKCIDLSAEKEPEIFAAIKKGALVENVAFIEGTNKINFSNNQITENTRVSYPLNYIPNAISPAQGSIPKNIFFLTCDAFGVLPPISKLNTAQAMYQFMSGYTAKVAGTETGIKEPVSTFSTCFGAPFLPLNPLVYAKLLGEKLKTHQTNVWLVNTGWSGGSYGVGTRIKLIYTREIINQVLNGCLENEAFYPHPIFQFMMPKRCGNVPEEILNPENCWQNKTDYKKTANHLANLFIKNFEKFEKYSNEEINSAKPNIMN